MDELPFLPIIPKLGAEIKLGMEINIGTKKHRIVAISRDETDKFEECEIKIERIERFLRSDAVYAIHKEPGGPVRRWPIN